MRIVVVTGVSGSGKSTALRALEDLDYYAIDNLPIALFEKLVELSAHGEVTKLALGVDARERSNPSSIPGVLEAARAAGHEVELLFVDASDAVLERRFSETRRPHPLSAGGSVRDGIAKERGLLAQLRASSDRIVDTSTWSTHDLTREIKKHYAAEPNASMQISVISFGYRNGVPPEADLVLDVRFLPNPHFVEELRPLSGEDEPCANYVLQREETRAFLERLLPLLEFLLPKYQFEGKAYLTIALGCTGGRHRSVALARHIADWIRDKGHDVLVRHRDLRV